MTAKSPTAVASASPAFSGWHRAAVPYYAGAVPRAFGRDDGGEAARWRDGEASPAAQATAGPATQGAPSSAGPAARGPGRNRGSGRGPQKRRPGEAPAVIWSGYGEAAPLSIPHTGALARAHAPAHAAARFGLYLGFTSIVKAIGTGPSGRWKTSCVWPWAHGRLQACRRRPAGAQTASTAASARRARGCSYSR
jgi:hypothetical protein